MAEIPTCVMCITLFLLSLYNVLNNASIEFKKWEVVSSFGTTNNVCYYEQ